MHWVELEIPVTPEIKAFLMQKERDRRVQERMLWLGRILAGVVVLLAAAAVYFRLDDATKALAQIRGALDEKVLREFRQIYREFALNRVDERILDRIDRRICNPLAILLQPEQSFAKLETGTDALARRLESEGGSLPKNLLSEPLAQADRVLARLEEILNDMRKLIEFNEALRVLRDLIQNEQKLVDEMKKLIQQKLKNDLDDK